MISASALVSDVSAEAVNSWSGAGDSQGHGEMAARTSSLKRPHLAPDYPTNLNLYLPFFTLPPSRLVLSPLVFSWACATPVRFVRLWIAS